MTAHHVAKVFGRRAFSAARLIANEAKPKTVAANNTLVSKPVNASLDIAQISGAPEELQQRVVRIFQQAPSATQVGTQQSKGWRLDWDVANNANRWEDPLIGYASSADYMQGTQIHFRSKEDAMRFATRQGWDYYVQEPHQRSIKVKQYADNFYHSSGKLKHIRTK